MVKCDEYKPSRRNSAPISPLFVHSSTNRRTRSFSAALKRLRFGLGTTSVSCTSRTGSIIDSCRCVRHRAAFALLRRGHHLLLLVHTTASETTPSPCTLNCTRVAVSLTLAERVRVAGPLSWLVSKTDALERRDKAKDAYDIVWLCECWPGGQAALAAELRASPKFSDPKAAAGLARLTAAFNDRDQLGPRQYAEFMGENDRERSALRAVGAVAALFEALRS